MLTKEERNIVVEAMRKYPAGVNASSWGRLDQFFSGKKPKMSAYVIELLPDDVLLEGG